jgi:hypothetical protein
MVREEWLAWDEDTASAVFCWMFMYVVVGLWWPVLVRWPVLPRIGVFSKSCEPVIDYETPRTFTGRS